MRAFDTHREEMDLSTIDMNNVDCDEDIEDGSAVDENGVVIGDSAEDAKNISTLPGTCLPNQVTVILPRSPLERAFAKAVHALPGIVASTAQCKPPKAGWPLDSARVAERAARELDG